MAVIAIPPKTAPDFFMRSSELKVKKIRLIYCMKINYEEYVILKTTDKRILTTISETFSVLM